MQPGQRSNQADPSSFTAQDAERVLKARTRDMHKKTGCRNSVACFIFFATYSNGMFDVCAIQFLPKRFLQFTRKID